MRILIVEDEDRIASFLEKGLSAEGYTTVTASDAPLGLTLALGEEVTLVLLDLLLPGGDGLDVLRAIRRAKPALPVIILTARDDMASKVRGLDLGATDYITKPFAFEEVAARIRAHLRGQQQAQAITISVGALSLDLARHVLGFEGKETDLSTREFSLIEHFMRHPDHVLSRAQLLSQVWSYSYDPNSNVVDVYITYLRRKLAALGCPPLLETVRGGGYRLRRPG